jgi:hypothetical protein
VEVNKEDAGCGVHADKLLDGAVRSEREVGRRIRPLLRSNDDIAVLPV